MALTEKDCQVVLENCFKTKNIKYIKHETKPLSEHSEGYMGEHYFVFITYEKDDKQNTEKFFIKQKPMSKSHQELIDNLNLYEKEIFLYDVIIKEFENRGYDVSFVPTSYNCIDNRAIVMENLVSQGYKQVERNNPFDLNKIQQLLKSLALYHAAGFAYEKSKSEELGRKYEINKEYPGVMEEAFYNGYISTENDMAKQLLDSIKRTILALIGTFPNNETFVEEFQDLYSKYDLGKIFFDKIDLPQTISHGDTWCSNMLFKFDGDLVTNCKLLDFQLLRRFCPTYDVLTAIYFNTTATFRKQHFDQLLKFYYRTLENTLKTYGHAVNDSMTYEQFLKAIPLTKVECLTEVLFKNVTILQPKENVTESMKEQDGFCDYLLDKIRFNAVKLVETDQTVANVFYEHLSDLYSALIEIK